MERLGDELRTSLRSAGVPDAGLLAEAARAWPDAVGPGLAAVAWPARIGRDGTLHVSVASSVWAFELTRLEEEIRSRLVAALTSPPGPPSLRFAVGAVPSPPRSTEPAAAARPAPDAAAIATADRLARTIEHRELRELMRRAAAASLSSHARDRSV